MRLEQIREALIEAKRLSNHEAFVIAGSLSILGSALNPPEKMSMSIDIDFYPQGDPGRAQEIAKSLGEGSDFHVERGYYLDPVSPDLPVLPDGWRDRLVRVRLGEVEALFIDANDAAVSKYARGAENDYRWIEAGLEAKILSLETIRARSEYATEYFDAADRERTRQALAVHAAAMTESGDLNTALLGRLRERLSAFAIEPTDKESGQYRGRILWADSTHAIQQVSPNAVAIHSIERCRGIKAGLSRTISYSEGKASVSPSREPDGGMGL